MQGGWFVVGRDDGTATFHVCETFAEVWEWCEPVHRLFVDIPIGLPAMGTRLADEEARQALPTHLKSTLFNTPDRNAVYANTKTETRRINRWLAGKSFPK